MQTQIEDLILRSCVYPLDSINKIPNNGSLDIFISELVKDQYFINSILHASPSLHHEIDKLEKGQLGPVEVEKLHISLMKYYIRMSTRCTPFGAFAGLVQGEVGNENKIELGEQNENTFFHRLDYKCLYRIIRSLMRDDQIKFSVKYYLNNTIYKVGEKYRYFEPILDQDNFSFQLSEISGNVLDEILKLDKTVPVKLSEILDHFTSEEYSKHELIEFIDELINSGILISELEPRVTETDFLPVLIDILKRTNVEKQIIDHLENAQAILNTKTQLDEVKMNELLNLVHFFDPEQKLTDLIHSDLYLSKNHLKLEKELVQNIVNNVSMLNNISAFNSNPLMEDFARKLQDQYEGSEVSLVEALDPEIGVGYESDDSASREQPNLLNELNVISKPASEETTLNHFQRFQLKKFIDSTYKSQKTINLDEDEIKKMANDQTKPGDYASMFLVGTLLKNVDLDIDNRYEYVFVLRNFIGPSASIFLGRFCCGDQSLTETVKKYCEENITSEEHAFSEIVHLPTPKMGNVVARPKLRKYEIPIITPGSVSTEDQILLSDLFIQIRNGGLELRSKRLNKKVIPRLSNAHNTRGSKIPVYKFLADFQRHGYSTGFYWDWGSLASYKYLPRVVYKNIILERARWIIDLPKTKKGQESAFNIESYVKEIRKEWEIPRLVTIAEGDNEILVDLENENLLKVLNAELKRKKSLILYENLITSKTSPIQKGNSQYANELVIPFNILHNENNVSSNISAESSDVKKVFYPGDEWTFIKIYTGHNTADELLIHVIEPYFESLIKDKKIESWFFIRYQDPDHHLRLRWAKSDGSGIYLVKDIQEQIKINSMITKKVQVDTYVREIDRYGKSIDLSERIFSFDSIATVKILKILDSIDNPEYYRWLLCMRNVNSFLNDCGYDNNNKLQFFSNLEKSMSDEFISNKSIMKNLNKKYREESQTIFGFLNQDDDHLNATMVEISNVLAERSNRIIPIINEIKNQYLANPFKFQMVVGSHVHMIINRFLKSDQRKQEWVIYTFMYKYYKSIIGREKQKKSRN
ncbi:MAG: lantibiotic dehydratase [Cytophagales bacterium]|nr:lantibiotic dehydratase [Cytophagales bacterium]